MNVFLDTSVVISACASTRGASSEICRRASERGWLLTVTPYVLAEAEANLPSFPAEASDQWRRLCPSLRQMPDVLTLDRPAVFGPAKDRPILFAALAWSDVLLTLDTNDFGTLIGNTFYGLPVLTPGMFLQRQAEA